MRNVIAVSSLALILALSVQAKGRPNSQPPMHNNAPAGTPHASADRDHGKDRAEDVGRGKKVGLDSKKHNNKGKHKGKKGNS